jgi:hypothetical protein
VGELALLLEPPEDPQPDASASALQEITTLAALRIRW